ncbi:tetratricopeptide repeat protein 4 [Copidosoma floridanum]|uniref:tetratricopeptide repeat protein 4 n=1 Tax=Copidosoma floridanum TaxID=29053 RepID=UPI0006C9D70C|nr:tetratricopeptide repeat protein 4 [Copidosoma floridanum]
MSKDSSKPDKKVYTDTDRLKLAEKLDKELDEFISNLDRKTYTEGWPEDRWQEEMEKHPFFMTKTPENPSEISPLVEGLQQLKFSEDCNTPDELAQNYKEDGNFNYKHKKYRLAVLSYSQGIACKSENTDLVAQLYNNRSLAQFQLQNYRSSLIDCKHALKLKPHYLKPLLTAAKCSFHVKDYDQCLDYCDEISSIPDLGEEVEQDNNKLRLDAVQKKRLMLRDARLQDLKANKIEKHKEMIMEAIKLSNIKVGNVDEFFNDSQYHVYLNNEGALVWPVIFLYPEFNQTDFVENFNEGTLIIEQLEEIFEETPSWDCESRYEAETVNVYFTGSDKKPHKINKNQSLAEVLQHELFIVNEAEIFLYILLANSKAEEHFLKINS